MKYLAMCPDLRRLDFTGCSKLIPSAAKHLATCPRLKHVAPISFQDELREAKENGEEQEEDDLISDSLVEGDSDFFEDDFEPL